MEFKLNLIVRVILTFYASNVLTSDNLDITKIAQIAIYPVLDSSVGSSIPMSDILTKLNELFMEEILKILRDKPVNDFDLNALYLANKIAEDKVISIYPDINFDDPDYLTKIIDSAKLQATQELLNKIEQRKLHLDQIKQSELDFANAAKKQVIRDYCKLWGWECPEF